MDVLIKTRHFTLLMLCGLCMLSIAHLKQCIFTRRLQSREKSHDVCDAQYGSDLLSLTSLYRLAERYHETLEYGRPKNPDQALCSFTLFVHGDTDYMEKHLSVLASHFFHIQISSGCIYTKD